MKNPHTAQRFAKTFSQFMPPAWVSWCGVVLLILSTLAAFAVAYFHDAYSSILNIRELAATDVGFKICIVLMVLAAMILAGIPLIALVLAGIGMLLGKREPGANECRTAEPPAPDKPESASDESAPATSNQSDPIESTTAIVETPAEPNSRPVATPSPATVDVERLRSILNTRYMSQAAGGSSKTVFDRLVDDLRIVRRLYRKSAKQDEIHYSDRNIIEIAKLLHQVSFMTKVPAFTDWCCTLFECLSIEPPHRRNIKGYEPSEQVKRQFRYLINR